MDTIGPDTGAEALADFIRRRSTPGSYHDVADSDSWLRLVPLHLGAYHDATGSNGFATSISFACKTSDWRRMTPAKRSGFLRNGAAAFADQQRWRKANGHPLTELRYISKAQSDAGWSGFTCHGWRDPVRRTDPGINEPNLFPFAEWLEHCRAALAGDNLTPTPALLGDTDMRALREPNGTVWLASALEAVTTTNGGLAGSVAKAYNAGGTYIEITHEEGLELANDAAARRARLLTDMAKAAGGDVDEELIVAGLAPILTGAVVAVAEQVAAEGGEVGEKRVRELAVQAVADQLATR